MLLLALLVLVTGAPAQAQEPHDRAAWMLTARWGVMTHYLADWIARRERPGQKMTVEEWNNFVDHFNVEALADKSRRPAPVTTSSRSARTPASTIRPTPRTTALPASPRAIARGAI
ncbi:MAG TPA: hypothetical protein VLI90_20220 [Tepidisphaeraceae bacterium]|nr:hypothetical protein [Tepidisphaeraceae bacterium]